MRVAPIAAAELLRFMIVFQLIGCAFNVELTSQRTALENQVLGSYQELDSDVVLMSSVRSLDSSGKKKESNLSELQERAVRARQNQQFNRDDIDELKTKEILGESNEGRLVKLPSGVGASGKESASITKLAEIMVEEENRDRAAIWQRLIQANENLESKDLGAIQKTYAKIQIEAAGPGTWVQGPDGQWSRKQ